MVSLVEIFHRQHTDVVAENFNSFLQNETYIDLIFVCAKNRKVGAHQMVMGGLSKFLSNLLMQNQNESKEKVIHIYVPDIRSKIMRHILEFVYTGKAMVNREDLGEFNDDLILLGMPLSALTSGVNSQPSFARTVPSPMTPSTPNPTPSVFQPPSDSMSNINIPTSVGSNPTSNFAMSNVESCSNTAFSRPNTNYNTNVINASRFLNQPDQLLPMNPMNTACSNAPGPLLTNQSPQMTTSTFGPKISAEVITSSIPNATSTPLQSSKTPNQKSNVKSEPKADKRRLPPSGSARKSLKFDNQCIDLIESDDDSDIISIT